MATLTINLPTGGVVITVNSSVDTVNINPQTTGIASGGIVIGPRNTPITINLNGISFGDGTSTGGYLDLGNNTVINTLNFNGINVINNSYINNAMSAIRIVKGNTLIINSSLPTDSLSCSGAQKAAGIGAGVKEDGGDITIDGPGTINAIGGYSAAGIGGGSGVDIGGVFINDRSDINSDFSQGTYVGGNAGTIIIKGNGIVNASGGGSDLIKPVNGTGGAGIGGGYFGSGGTICILEDVTVNAIGSYFGAAIGGGFGGISGNIGISTNGIVKAHAGEYASGIGGGYLGKGQNINIVVNNSITAISDNEAAGIGGGCGRTFSNIPYGGDGGIIIITGDGTLTSTGGPQGAGIGGGVNGNATSINISGSVNLTAIGGNDIPGGTIGTGAGAGIGGGGSGCTGNITIINLGTVEAIGGSGVGILAAEDIGAGGNCTTKNMDRLLLGPNFKNIDSPKIVPIAIIYKDNPYVEGKLTLNDGSESYETETNSNGVIYFYGDSGDFQFNGQYEDCYLEEVPFIVPPIENTPKELKFICNCTCRGINLFSI